MLTPEHQEEYLNILYELSEEFLAAVQNAQPTGQCAPLNDILRIAETANNTLVYYDQAFFVGTIHDNAHQIVLFRRGAISTPNIPVRSMDIFWKILAHRIFHLQQYIGDASSPQTRVLVSLAEKTETNLDIAFLMSPIDFFIGVVERDMIHYFLKSHAYTRTSYSKRSLCENILTPDDIAFINGLSF